jgi:2-oxoglutarate ferredoxin oxidoreductase subunit beta
VSTTANPPRKTNRIGLDVLGYRGSKTTLCAGCGHNAISERIVEVFFEMGIQPWSVAKFSGIGCSSKSPAYFLSLSHGFNAVHGRAPAVATGAMLANRNLLGMIVTGDGDTASIGIGQYMHLLRRNLPLIYIIEDNGVYGLTKGQFSATAEYGSKSKGGVLNEMQKIDCCLLGIELGATLVARSFSGDKRQLQAILKACLSHKGLSVIDVISPCTTFNDHEGSTKSYAYMKEHDLPIHEIDYVPHYDDIAVEIGEGEARDVTLHDGSVIRLKKLGRDYDPTDKWAALKLIHDSEAAQEVVTGILYLDTKSPNFMETLGMMDEPLATLPESVTRPPKAALEQVMEELR